MTENTQDQHGVAFEELEEEEDILQQPDRDPWGQQAHPAGSPEGSGAASSQGKGGGELRGGMSGRSPQYQHSFAQVSLPIQDGGTSQRIIHDVPPVWDRKDPENQAEPYLKLLQG